MLPSIKTKLVSIFKTNTVCPLQLFKLAESTQTIPCFNEHTGTIELVHAGYIQPYHHPFDSDDVL